MFTKLLTLLQFKPPARTADIIIGIVISLLTVNVQALPDDSQQPIIIQSNAALRDDKLGVTVYSGNVQMEQGSMQIKAETVTLTAQNNEITKIVAVGDGDTLASFKQQPKTDADNVEAYAQTIEYRVVDEVITLIEQALLVQPDGSTIASNSITYDVNAARVEAGGQNGQVETIINPKNSID